MLQGQLLADLMSSLRRSHDYVIIEAPSAAATSDAQAIAGLADDSILVVQSDTANRDTVARIRRQFASVGAPMAGFVLAHGKLPSGPASPGMAEQLAIPAPPMDALSDV
jgi:Mrp family chromosome partitioning ATPase